MQTFPNYCTMSAIESNHLPGLGLLSEMHRRCVAADCGLQMSELEKKQSRQSCGNSGKPGYQEFCVDSVLFFFVAMHKRISGHETFFACPVYLDLCRWWWGKYLKHQKLR